MRRNPSESPEPTTARTKINGGRPIRHPLIVKAEREWKRDRMRRAVMIGTAVGLAIGLAIRAVL